MKPTDIQIPSIIKTGEGREAYCERLCILSEGAPITEPMRMVALTQALDTDRAVKGELNL